ncbi:hypothetical protein NDU88_002308 [Pleurodeles waltl]|uniref:Uncharacterized protein n=1 Tax=Pleurodeles waltl TaxID=8319 RepID=A0AAV7SCV3_PLEWA|nr:hypothetical protein NDU88_002308 [Pleurodeles waltl]
MRVQARGYFFLNSARGGTSSPRLPSHQGYKRTLLSLCAGRTRAHARAKTGPRRARFASHTPLAEGNAKKSSNSKVPPTVLNTCPVSTMLTREDAEAESREESSGARAFAVKNARDSRRSEKNEKNEEKEEKNEKNRTYSVPPKRHLLKMNTTKLRCFRSAAS